MAFWTPADLEAAKAALLTTLTSGKTVTFADRSWTSHNLDELRALVAEIERAVGATPTSRLAAFRKGA